MKNELSVDMSTAMQEATISPSAPQVPSTVSQPDSSDDFVAPEPSFWDDPSKELGKSLGLDLGDEPAADEPAPAVAKAEQAAAAAQITYKANGKEHVLDLSKPEVIEEVRKKLAAADGANKAFAEKAKAEQQLKALQAEIEQAREYQESWNKLESLKYDKAKLLEVLTGQKYDDFIAEEVAKYNIKTMGTEEERRLLEQQERIRLLEERLRLGEDKIKKEAEAAERKRLAAEKAEAAAKQAELETSVKHEFFKNVDDGMADDVREMLYQKSILDLKKLHKEYGKLTQKMIAKTFADNSKRLKSLHSAAVDTQNLKATDNKKQAATAAAQAASTKNYDSDLENVNLANLPADKLFQLLRFTNSRRK